VASGSEWELVERGLVPGQAGICAALVEVAAAILPTGSEPDWPQNSRVLALLEVIARSCVGMVSEKGLGVRKCEGLVEAMGDGRLAAKTICFFIKSYREIREINGLRRENDRWQMINDGKT
jgi:hypothetical protein